MQENYIQFKPGGRFASGIYQNFVDKIAVVVNKTGITLIGKAEEVLGSSGWLAVFDGNTTWAMKPVSKGEGGFKVLLWGGDKIRNNKKHINPSAFIREAKLVVGGIYVGKIENGMAIFSKMPSDMK